MPFPLLQPIVTKDLSFNMRGQFLIRYLLYEVYLFSLAILMQMTLDEVKLLKSTNNALLMHPLPVRRNVAATDAVLDGDRSRIYDQAANRAHVQKALLMQLLN